MELRDEITLKVGQNFKCLGEDLASRVMYNFLSLLPNPGLTKQYLVSLC